MFEVEEYGAKSSGLNRIIGVARSIVFIDGPTIINNNEVAGNILTHVAGLIALVPDKYVPEVPNISWIIDHLNVLRKDSDTADPYWPWGSQWKQYNEVVSLARKAIVTVIRQSADLIALIKPPLWPIEGNPLVSGEPIIANPVKLADTFRDLTTQDRETLWALICQAEDNLWDALLWQIAEDRLSVPNAFEPLMYIYEKKCFPMGWSADNFFIYQLQL